MTLITIAGIRNEHWRRELSLGHPISPRYARLYITMGVQHHPRGTEALRHLLTCPPQIAPAINPWGECDMLKVVLGGDTFFLKVDCYAATWGNPEEASEDSADDEKTTRVYTCLLASDY